jgi:hypothetical protein
LRAHEKFQIKMQDAEESIAFIECLLKPDAFLNPLLYMHNSVKKEITVTIELSLTAAWK